MNSGRNNQLGRYPQRQASRNEQAMVFVIKLTNKAGDPPLYICAVPMTTPGDYENTPVGTLEEARCYPYPTAEAAAHVAASLPATKNISYEVIAVEAAQSTTAG